MASQYRSTNEPVVSGCNYNDDTGFPCGFNSLAKRIQRVALSDGSSQGEIYHPYVVSGFERYGRVDCRDNPAVRTLAILIENPKINQISTRSHAF